ncbi:MAG: preprotein translocase subunit YajC [Firmicutes bacterium]|nr:preprotein translocase subunit YajC [Bacillota bacterium]
MNGFTVLLDGGDVSPIINGGEAAPAANANTGAAAADPNASAAPAAPTSSLFSPVMIVFWVLILGAMYFITIRPQRKRDKQMKELQASMKVGDSVLTSAGLFGKIVGVGEDCFIVEFGTNKGIHIPVRKSDVLGVKEPVLTPVARDSGKD